MLTNPNNINVNKNNLGQGLTQTSNTDPNSFLNNKRTRSPIYNDPFNMDTTNKLEFNNDTSLSVIKRNEDFAVPLNSFNNQNTLNNINNLSNLNPSSSFLTHTNSQTFFKRESINYPQSGTHNFEMQPAYNSNFFANDTNKSPLVPNRGFVSYYNYGAKNNNNINNPSFTSPNRSSKSNDGLDYSSENITTPSQNTNDYSTLNLPDSCAPKLQNIVSTVNLKCALDLRDIALKAKNAEYNPKRFAAVIMRIREPKTTSLIFASGKMVCTGARSEEDSRKASRQYAKIIQRLGYPVKFAEFKIQNIVGSCDVKFPIKLEGLYSTHSKFCSYEPEMFPGLIYKMADPKIVLLIFVSGKIVLTGAKERHDIFNAFQKIYPVLINYKKQITTAPSSNNNFLGLREEEA